MKSHKDLDVWQKAVDFAAEIYFTTKKFPADEKFGLTSQLRRAAVSIASNIAEGAARTGHKEFLHFLSIATGSASEVSTQLLIAQKIKVGDTMELVALNQEVEQISKMLQGLMRSLRKRHEL